MAEDNSELAELTTLIVASYVSHDEIEADKLAEIIATIHQALASAGGFAPTATTTAWGAQLGPGFLAAGVGLRSGQTLGQPPLAPTWAPSEARFW